MGRWVQAGGKMMFKSIFTKLLVTYLVIIIAVISIISLTLSIALNNYIFGQKQENLERMSLEAQNLVTEYFEGNITLEELNASFNAMGYTTDSRIYAIKVDETKLSDPEQLGEDLDEAYLIDALKTILSGEKVFLNKQYTEAFDTYMVFLGVPLKIDGQIEGAILTFSPVSQVTSNITKINTVILVVSIFAIVVGAVFIYINSLRVSRPIKKMEEAAKKLALGKKVDDIKITTKDEIGQLSNTFNYMKRQLNAIERMRREFIASISHDLRTPLTSIIGFLEAMLDGLIKPKDYNRYLKSMRDEALRLGRLTEDILESASIQSVNTKLKKEYFNVYNLITDITNSTSSNDRDKETHINVDCPKDLRVFADIDRLKQILINLVSNSIKYSKESVNIFITVKENKDKIVFSVKDNGMGISPEELPFIFDKFYRVDKSRQTNGGTGLGLNIVKDLVELHGGSIYAQSQINEWTEFTFELPKV